MVRASVREARAQLPEGVTLIETNQEDFVVSSVIWIIVANRVTESARQLALRIASAEITAVAFDLSGLDMPTCEQAHAINRFVDELQQRGTSVVVHGASGGFLTAATMDGDMARFARETDLAGAVGVLRQYDEMRRRCTSERGLRLNQLRMPATALSVPGLCSFVRGRLEEGGLDEEHVGDLLHEAYYAMMETLERFPPGEGDLSAAATVHDGRATVTLLDSGRPAGTEELTTDANPRVDRRHRFRILDRHNALVLEKDLCGPPVAGEGVAPVS